MSIQKLSRKLSNAGVRHVVISSKKLKLDPGLARTIKEALEPIQRSLELCDSRGGTDNSTTQARFFIPSIGSCNRMLRNITPSMTRKFPEVAAGLEEAIELLERLQDYLESSKFTGSDKTIELQDMRTRLLPIRSAITFNS